MSASTRRALKAGLLVALAAIWLLAAYKLWQTSVPDDLELPAIDVGSFVSDGDLERAERFSLVLGLIGLAGLAVPLVVLGLYARYGRRFMSESAAGPIGTGMLLGMLGFGILIMAMLPIDLLQLWWLRRYGFAKTGYDELVVGSWLTLGGVFLGICLLILTVMGFARWLGDRWWLAVVPIFLGLSLLFTFTLPYETDTEPLRDRPELVHAKERLAAREGVDNIPLEVEEVSDSTTFPNAYATGLGPSRRIVLYDTMLDGRFSEPALENVVAHELAHHKHRHLWKGLAWAALILFPIGFLVAQITKRQGGMVAPLAVPLFLFAWVALPVLTLPIDNAFSRRLEAEADWTAIETTRDPKGGEELFQGFIETSEQDPDPPLWDQIIFGSHPTEKDRLAMIAAWQERNATEPGSP